jgi:parallel beta-helix repeat protein
MRATLRTLVPYVLLPVVAACSGGGGGGLPAVVDPDTSTATIPAGTVVANGVEVATVTVTVLTDLGNPIAGRAVALVASGASNVLVQPAATDVNGVTTGTVATTLAELKTVTITVEPGPDQVVLTQTPSATFIGDPATISAGLSTAVAAPALSVVADGVEASTITVTARDVNGNAVAGQVVTLAATGTDNTVSQPLGSTDASGATSGDLASTRAEIKTVTATINPGAGQVEVTQQPTVEFIGDPNNIDAAASTAVASPPTHVAADGAELSTLTVTVRDVNSNPVAGQVVVLAGTGVGNVLTQPPGVTDASGATSGTLASTAAERKTLSAVVNPGPSQVVVAGQPTVDFAWNTAGVYYVRATGTDPAGCTGGTTPTTAWRSIGKAASCVGPGATVYVGAGTYYETVSITTSGVSGSPIRYVADVSGERTGDAGEVIVDGGIAAEVFHLDGVDYVEIEDFTIVGTLAGGPPAGGIRLGDGACTNIVIRGNTLYDNAIGIYVLDADGTVIEGNRVTDGWILGDGIVISSSDNVTVTGNLVYDNAGRGLVVESGSSGTIASANTFCENADDQVFLTSATSSLTFTDNIVVLGLQDGIDVDPAATLVMSNNDVWGNAVLDYRGTVAGPGDISADPLFDDPDGPDGELGGTGWVDDRFELGVMPSSPAYDVGSANADAITTPDGLTLAHRTTRTDGMLDGSGADGVVANMGYHYDVAGDLPPWVEAGDVRLFYAEATGREVRWRAFDDSGAGWGFERSLPPGDANVRWVEAALSPLNADDQLTGLLTEEGGNVRFDVFSWSGTRWRRDFRQTSLPSAAHRGFDIAYESTSGDALAVYSNGTTIPRYRTRVDGIWSDDTSFVGAPAAGPIHWVELEARAGTDEIGLAYCTSDDDLVASIWDGTQWVTLNYLEADLTVFSGEVENRVFDLAWETIAGDLMVAWGRAGSPGSWWAVRPSGSSFFGAPANLPTTPGFAPNLIDLATEPGADRIALAAYDHDGVERFGMGVWDGVGWVNAGQYDTFSPDLASTGPGDLSAAVGWVGVTGVAVCLFSDDDTGGLDWARWDSVGGWVVQPDEPVAGFGATDSVRILYRADQTRVVALVSDDSATFWTASYDGATWTVTAPAHEAALASTSSAPFAAVHR